MKEYERIQVLTREDLPTKPPKAWQRQCPNGYVRTLSDPSATRQWVEFSARGKYAVLLYESERYYFK